MGTRLFLLALGALVLAGLVWFALGGRGSAPRGPEPAADAGEPVTAPHDADDASTAAEAHQRESLAAVAGAARTLVLALVRHPDEAPLAHATVATEPPARVPSDGWLGTGADGRVALELPAGTATLAVRVPGHEPAELALVPGVTAERLALVPSSGLFGRVLRPDGSPAAGAALALTLDERVLYYPRNATRSQPHAYVSGRPRTAASAVASASGGYYLPHATRTSRASVEVRATTEDGLSAQLGVELPREPVALADLVLAEPERLHVRAVDLAGAPVAGVTVIDDGRPYPGTTDAAGVLAIAAPSLPATPFARADGWWQRERRHDGVAVDLAAPVESCATRVELVLVPAPGARLRVVDAETGMTVYLGHGRVDLVHAGVFTGSSSFEMDRTGSARLRFFDDEQEPDGELPELVRIHYEREGYVDGLLEVDPRLVGPDEVLELALEPDPAFPCLRGRVLRAGAPVAGLQVGLKAQRRADGVAPRTWQYSRGYTDADGRFALRWRAEPGLVVTAFPHWFEYAEYGFIGPLDAARAVEGEHVLELLPAVRVPALVRGVVAEGVYSYYVHVLDDDGAVTASTTINGAPLALAGAGEVRTSLTLPSHRRVSVTIGFRTDSSVISGGSPPVVHDPAHPVLPLAFDVRPLFARVSGRVAGVAPEELARCGVSFVRPYEQTARLAEVADDGSFELARLPLGKGALYLVRTGERGASEVLACVELDLTGDREGLVVTPDPASLPDEPSER